MSTPCRGRASELVVPLRRKKRVIGALNLLSKKPGQFTERDEAILRQFGAHVAVALENARLFDRERQYSATLETLAEIGQEVASILDLDELLERIAVLARRLVDYRTFGILLLNDAVGRARDEARHPLRRQAESAAGEARGRASSGSRPCTGKRRARARRLGGPALHPGRSRTAARSWRSRCW